MVGPCRALARLIELRDLQERLDAEVLRAVADCDAADAWQRRLPRRGLVAGVEDRYGAERRAPGW